MPEPVTLSNGEVLVRTVRPHWIRLALPAFVYLLLLVISVLLFTLAGITAHHYLWLTQVSFFAALLLFLAAHHWFFFVLMGEAESHIILTNKRFIYLHERLFLDEEMREVAFEKMNSVTAHKQGFLPTILRYGTLQFELGVRMPFIPHPNRLVKEIEQLMGLK